MVHNSRLSLPGFSICQEGMVRWCPWVRFSTDFLAAVSQVLARLLPQKARWWHMSLITHGYALPNQNSYLLPFPVALLGFSSFPALYFLFFIFLSQTREFYMPLKLQALLPAGHLFFFFFFFFLVYFQWMALLPHLGWSENPGVSGSLKVRDALLCGRCVLRGSVTPQTQSQQKVGSASGGRAAAVLCSALLCSTGWLRSDPSWPRPGWRKRLTWHFWSSTYPGTAWRFEKISHGLVVILRQSLTV